MSSYKIYQTIPSIHDEAKGPSYSVQRLNASINDSLFQSEIVTLDGTNMTRDGVISFNSGFGPSKLGRSPTMYRWLKNQAASKRVDLIHNHSLWMMPNVYPGWVSKRYDVPLINSPRGTFAAQALSRGSYVKKLFWPLLQRPSLESTACFHATAESEYQDIRAMGFQQPVAVIPNGIDIPNLPPKKSGKDIKTLLFLGRIHPIKGLDMLLKSWQAVQFKYPSWHLKVVGSDNYGYLSTLKELSSSLKLERIEFGAPVYGNDKWQEYYNADLYILPTYSENFGVSIAEAFASSTPVITTKGAPWEVINEYQAGWWVDVSISDLVKALDEALSLPHEDLLLMGQRGKLMVQDKFDWHRVGKQMRELYLWIMNGGSRPDFVFVR